MQHKFWWEDTEVRYPLQDTSELAKTTIKKVLKKLIGRVYIGCIVFTIDVRVDCYKPDNELRVPLNAGTFLTT